MTTSDSITITYQALRAAHRAGNKFTALVREHTTAADYSLVCAVADKAVASLPVVKGDDGKDANAQERNDLVRTIRRALSIVGKERGQKLTIKRIDGVHVVSVGGLDETKPADESNADSSDGSADNASDDALWSAVEIVLSNLGNAAVLSAIRSGLDTLAKSVR